MSYYRGDYYRGDYYRGDIFKSIGKVVKKIAPVVGGLVGGPLGAVAGKVLGSLGGSSRAPVQSAGIGNVIGTAIKVGARTLPAIGTGVALAQGAGALSNFFGGGGGRRRSMNHLNPRALARATRRVEGFVKKARKAVSPLGYTIKRKGAGVAKRKCR